MAAPGAQAEVEAGLGTRGPSPPSDPEPWEAKTDAEILDEFLEYLDPQDHLEPKRKLRRPWETDENLLGDVGPEQPRQRRVRRIRPSRACLPAVSKRTRRQLRQNELVRIYRDEKVARRWVSPRVREQDLVRNAKGHLVEDVRFARGHVLNDDFGKYWRLAIRITLREENIDGFRVPRKGTELHQKTVLLFRLLLQLIEVHQKML